MRMESSALVSDGESTVHIDVTRDFEQRSAEVEACDVVLLTHGHADAIRGLAALGRWLGAGATPVPIDALGETIAAARRRFQNLDHCDFREVRPGDEFRTAGWDVGSIEVPHAANPEKVPTLAWKLTRSGHGLVYASDVSEPSPDLKAFAGGMGLLVIDGATHGRRIFTHLRIDQDLEVVCTWGVGSILFTQIGKSVPAHENLVTMVQAICDKAPPAHDGLRLDIP